jgi:hypothetical protein
MDSGGRLPLIRRLLILPALSGLQMPLQVHKVHHRVTAERAIHKALHHHTFHRIRARRTITTSVPQPQPQLSLPSLTGWPLAVRRAPPGLNSLPVRLHQLARRRGWLHLALPPLGLPLDHRPPPWAGAAGCPGGNPSCTHAAILPWLRPSVAWWSYSTRWSYACQPWRSSARTCLRRLLEMGSALTRKVTEMTV